MLPGETILSGASKKCPNCHIAPLLKVCHSFAGYYVGTHCNCGPYSRETQYFETSEEAEIALMCIKKTGDHESVRKPGYWPTLP